MWQNRTQIDSNTFRIFFYMTEVAFQISEEKTD